MIQLMLAMLSLSPDSTIAQRVFASAPVIWEISITENIDPYLVASVAWVESRYSRTATSTTSDCGIMQINTRWSPYTCKQLVNLRTCIKAGIRALLYWRARFSKRKPAYQWLCHYNSGNKCNSRSIRYARKVRRIHRLLKRKPLPAL